ncbi:hypothetical protein [Bacillus sp. 165]|nr:hypothetical protein [Bacillus sp. 165]MBO9128775.1 hypothetical protein [Bacillus sp. 165]
MGRNQNPHTIKKQRANGPHDLAHTVIGADGFFTLKKSNDEVLYSQKHK